MEKRILSYLLTIAVVLGGFALPVHGAEPILKEDVRFTLTNVSVGNICNTDAVSFNLKLRNPETTQRTFTVSYTVTDHEGNNVAQNTVTEKIPEKTVKLCPYSVPLPAYNTYELMVTVTSNGELMAEQSKKFAYIKKNSGLNFDLGCSSQIRSGYDKAENTISQMTETGFGIVRDSIRWETADNGDGTYTILPMEMDWINRANEAGMKVILLAWNSHPDYSDGSLPDTQAGLDAIKAYSAQIAKQLKGKIWAYEVWNEPNNYELSTNWHVTTGTQYATVLKAVHEGIRSEDQETPIIGGALTPLWEDKTDTVAYLREMMEAGAGDYMDGFSFHPYSYDGAYYDEGMVLDNLEAQVSYASNILKEYNFTKGIYLTEVGASTHDNEAAGSQSGVTEWEQAVSLSRTLTMAEALEQVKAATFYTWMEKSFNPADAAWGVVERYYTAPKPAYAALSFRNHILGGIANREKMEQGVYAYHPENGGGIFALWSEMGMSETFTIDRTGEAVGYSANTITCPEDYVVKAYDMYGNAIEGDTLTVGEAPVYVSCMPKSGATISVDDGVVTVNGVVSDKEQPVTILAQKAGESTPAYINQVFAGSEGTYQVSFPIDADGITAVAVYDGTEKNKQNLSQVGMLDIRFYQGDTEIASPDAATSGTLSVKVKAKASQELLAFAAVYGADDVMTSVDSDKVNNTEETTLTVTMEEGAEFKFMLWDTELNPKMTPITSK